MHAVTDPERGTDDARLTGVRTVAVIKSRDRFALAQFVLALLGSSTIAVVVGLYWQHLDPGTPTRVVVSRSGQDPDNWQIAIDATGEFEENHGPIRRRGRASFTPVAQALSALPELRLRSAAASVMEPEGVILWIVGSRRTISPFFSPHDFRYPLVERMASHLRRSIIEAERRQDADRIRRLSNLQLARSIEFDARGSMCGLCMILDVRSSGFATMTLGITPVHIYRGTIDWRSLVRGLASDQPQFWERKYYTGGEDMPTGDMIFRFPDANETVAVRNMSSAPIEIANAALRFYQLAARTSWSPGVDAVTKAAFVRIRRMSSPPPRSMFGGPRQILLR